MSLFRPTVFTKSENCPSEVPPTAGRRGTLSSEPPLSATLHEAIMDSVSSVRDSLPKEHRVHFETLRQEIFDFTKAHGIPRESLGKPDLLREATGKLSIPDLERLALLLERFEYLIVKKEPWKNTEAIEYGEKFYHLKEQYNFQVSLLEQVGILENGVISGIDGHEYPVPTFEQIAIRLFERREELSTKHDQGFTKLLLVPFGMSLDSLYETLEQFLFKYKQNHPDFDFGKNKPLWRYGACQDADVGESPNLVYYPKVFDKKHHQSRTKIQILEEQKDKKDFSPGWTVHLFQPSDPSNLDSTGLAPIPLDGEGVTYGEKIPRKDIETGKTLDEYLSILQASQDDPESSYFQESGMTPEDWIVAFITHLTETTQLLDNCVDHTRGNICLVGSFFPSFLRVLYVHKDGNTKQIDFDVYLHSRGNWDIGTRFSVIV